MINPDWTLNIPSEDWADRRLIAKYENIVFVAQCMIDYNLTIRQAAANYCISKSSISRQIEKYLKWLDYDLYLEIKKRLMFHKKHTSAWRRRW